MLSGHREVLPQPVQQRETLGGEAGPPERRGWYAPSRDCTVFRGNYCLSEQIRYGSASVETETQLVLDSSCVPVPFHTAFRGACFRGAGPGSMAQTSARRMPSHGLVAEVERRRTSRGRHSAPRAPQESGATIPGTQRRPGQTDTRARGTIEESASYPTPASNHRLPKGRSIFIIPSAAKRHKGLTTDQRRLSRRRNLPL